jgi:outer membrane protein OmpA-like peptidoglycan-associated protein
MKLSTSTTRNVRRVIAVCACASTLGACHGSTTTPQLRDARRAYENAEDGPAATYATGELRVARRALNRAEEVHDDDPGSDREARLAYLAGRKAEIAHAHGEMAAAERAKAAAKANAEYQQQLARSANADQRPLQAAKVDRNRDRDPKPEVALQRERDRRPAVDRQPVAERPRQRSEARAAAALQSLSQVANVKEEQRGIVITLSGALLFPSGQERLSPIARQSLDQVAAALAQQPSDAIIQIEGHTDDSGSERQNALLSKQRAQAVADHLMEREIEAARIRVIGHGEQRPIADNDTAEGRSANRRVEIVISSPSERSSEDDS